MVPDIAKKGTSFKGAFAYYLHDKRQDGEASRSTAERIAWTETRNLATDDPALAQRVMIATALQADQLKAAAGVANTGRKSDAHVYAYSLAWHPDEAASLTREEMRAAVDASLQVLEADHLQAVIVCHQDQKHPHVHVILNRVDPATGKMHGFSNDRHKLDAWAHAYEEARGKIVTPNRAEKHERIKAERAPENAQERPKPVAPVKVLEKSKAALLADLGAAQKARHAQEWKDLQAANKTAREAAWAERPSFKDIAAQHRVDTRPEWSAFGKQQAAERRAFHARERTLTGTISNAIDAVRSRQIRGDGSDRGFLGQVFLQTINAQSRTAEFTGRQAQEKAAFAASMSARLDGKISAAKVEHGDKLATVRRGFEKARLDLIANQDLERGEIRDAWRQIYADREKAGAAGRYAAATRERMVQKANAQRPPQNFRQARRLDRRAAPIITRDNQARTAPGRAVATENPKVKREFDKARQLPDANKPQLAPTEQRQLTTPAPQPTPRGDVVTPHRTTHEVPKVDRAAEWAKTQKAEAREKPTPAARSDWAKAAPALAQDSPSTATPARTDWAKSADRKPTPEPEARDRSKDRDFDRDR